MASDSIQPFPYLLQPPYTHTPKNKNIVEKSLFIDTRDMERLTWNESTWREMMALFKYVQESFPFFLFIFYFILAEGYKGESFEVFFSWDLCSHDLYIMFFIGKEFVKNKKKNKEIHF